MIIMPNDMRCRWILYNNKIASTKKGDNCNKLQQRDWLIRVAHMRRSSLCSVSNSTRSNLCWEQLLINKKTTHKGGLSPNENAPLRKAKAFLLVRTTKACFGHAFLSSLREVSNSTRSNLCWGTITN